MDFETFATEYQNRSGGSKFENVKKTKGNFE